MTMKKLLVALLAINLSITSSFLHASEVTKKRIDISYPMAVYTGGTLTGGNTVLGGTFQF